MKCLCVCPTYGRLPFLGRMLAGFLKQDYEDKHLVIINDDKNVKIDCEYDNVTCININKKILVDEKRNIGTMLGDYDIIFPYDDDDFFYPERLTKHVKIYENNPQIDLYQNATNLVIYNGCFSTSGSWANAISFRKKAFLKVGGYDFLKDGAGEDVAFLRKFSNNRYFGGLDYDFLYVFYTNSYHLSNPGTMSNIEQRAYDQLKRMDMVGKTFNIIPDYQQHEFFMNMRYELLRFSATNIPIKMNDHKYEKLEDNI